ncbi:MAG: hypothetical protein ABSA77_05565 [Thermoguttaceae bacterium]|jgi:hypothetical protein
MFLPPYKLFLPAEQDRMQDLFRAFRAAQAREGTDEVVYGLLILAGIVMAIFILSLLVNSRQRQKSYAGPWGLFFSLCRAHKLNWKDRWLLWRLARLEQLADPARLFLEPQWFAADSLPGALRQRAKQLKSIRDRLFADLKESHILSDPQQSPWAEPIEPTGAALPALKVAPELDIPPWSATVPSPPLPPLSNTSDGATV